MSQPYSPSPEEGQPVTRDEIISALFAHMVVQQTNLCMMLLGKVPHPQTGQVMQDLESAKLLIDQLEMLEEKTRGNLSKEEADLLKEAQTHLRMAFVDVVDPTDTIPNTPSPSSSVPTGIVSPTPEPVPAPAPAATTAPSKTSIVPPDDGKEAPDDSRKRFSKKY